MTFFKQSFKKISKLVSKSFVVIGLALLAAVVVAGGGGLAAAAIFRRTNTRVFLSVQVALAANSYDRQIEHFCFQFARFRIL